MGNFIFDTTLMTILFACLCSSKNFFRLFSPNPLTYCGGVYNSGKQNLGGREMKEDNICPICEENILDDNKGICDDCFGGSSSKPNTRLSTHNDGKQKSTTDRAGSKYCSKCGHENEEGFKFCSSCGYQTNAVKQRESKKSKTFNIADNGKGNSAIGIAWLVFLLSTAAYIGIGLFIYNQGAPVRGPSHGGIIRRDGNDMVMLMGIIVMVVLPIIELFITVSRATGISVTKINVNNNEVFGVSGKQKGLRGSFGLGGVSNTKFRLGYDRISSVSQTSNSITVHSYGASYKVYVKNPASIANAINENL